MVRNILPVAALICMGTLAEAQQPRASTHPAQAKPGIVRATAVASSHSALKDTAKLAHKAAVADHKATVKTRAMSRKAASHKARSARRDTTERQERRPAKKP